jgi:hypothetical protein
MTTPVETARQHFDSEPEVRRRELRTKPARVKREPRRLTLRLSGFVWSLIGAAVAGGIGNMVLIVALALTFGSQG